MVSPNAGSSRQPAEAQTAGHTSERWIPTPPGAAGYSAFPSRISHPGPAVTGLRRVARYRAALPASRADPNTPRAASRTSAGVCRAGERWTVVASSS